MEIITNFPYLGLWTIGEKICFLWQLVNHSLNSHQNNLQSQGDGETGKCSKVIFHQASLSLLLSLGYMFNCTPCLNFRTMDGWSISTSTFLSTFDSIISNNSLKTIQNRAGVEYRRGSCANPNFRTAPIRNNCYFRKNLLSQNQTQVFFSFSFSPSLYPADHVSSLLALSPAINRFTHLEFNFCVKVLVLLIVHSSFIVELRCSMHNPVSMYSPPMNYAGLLTKLFYESWIALNLALGLN